MATTSWWSIQSRSSLLTVWWGINLIFSIPYKSLHAGFFLAGGNIVLQAGPAGTIQGLTITGNEFSQSVNDTIVFDQRAYAFSTVQDVYIAGNIASSEYTIKSTASLALTNSSVWSFDFSSALLLPYINTVTYSIQIEGESFARHASRPPNGLVVEIVTDVPVNATVFVSVDQSTPSHPINTPGKYQNRKPVSNDQLGRDRHSL